MYPADVLKVLVVCIGLAVGLHIHGTTFVEFLGGGAFAGVGAGAWSIRHHIGLWTSAYLAGLSWMFALLVVWPR